VKSPTAPSARPSKVWLYVTAAAYGLWLVGMAFLAVLRMYG